MLKTLKDSTHLLASRLGALVRSKMGRIVEIGRVWGTMECSSSRKIVGILVMGTLHHKMRITFPKLLKIRI